jgi:calcineurin-like phosphoesterase family protein
MFFYTSDQHYNHAKSIEYCKRPFKDVNEMNEEMIKRHNEVVTPKDTVHHLGDFAFGDPVPIIKRLNGNHIFLQGSHDRFPNYVQTVYDVYESKYQGTTIFLSHYSHRRWPRSHYGSWHLFGHSHNGLESFGYSFDCGVDTNNFYPYSFDQIKERMDKIIVTEYIIHKGRRDENNKG